MPSKKKPKLSRIEIQAEALLRLVDQHIEKIESSGKEQSSPAAVIRERVTALTGAMAPLRLKSKTVNEIAFAVAEISPELERMLAIIERANKGDSLSRDDLVSLQAMAYHWPDHLKDLRRYLLRAFDEIE